MVLLNNIADSLTKEELEGNIDELKTSLFWRNSQKLQDYFKNTWEPHLSVSFIHYYLYRREPLDEGEGMLTL